MTTFEERAPITLDYLKGKRRAEKALGFLTDIGRRLLTCSSPDGIAQTVADQVVRFHVDLCLVDDRPAGGSAVRASALAVDLDAAAPGTERLIGACRAESDRSASRRTELLDRLDTTLDVDDSTVHLHRFALSGPDGEGGLTVARFRPGAAAFTEAELTLLADVAARYVSAVRCLPDDHQREE